MHKLLLATAAILFATTPIPTPTRPSPDRGGLSVAALERLKQLPGGLAALPAASFPVTPVREAKIRLGHDLFFDVRLSMDNSMSCATCHAPEHAFADGRRYPSGFRGKTLRRNSPTVLNAAYTVPQFWDGRATGLEAQATMPIMSNDEMNMGSEDLVVRRLEEDASYPAAFRQVYGSRPNLKLVGDAVAAFEQTLVTPDSPFDRYARGDRAALDDRQKRGLLLFVGKAACTQCHSGPNFTDGGFYNLGVDSADDGRYEVTKNAADRGAFKTPTLRNVALTAPYLHDGSMATLEEVVDFYNRGGGAHPGKSSRIFELDLTPAERTDLVAFLRALTGTMPRFAEKR